MRIATLNRLHQKLQWQIFQRLGTKMPRAIWYACYFAVKYTIQVKKLTAINEVIPCAVQLVAKWTNDRKVDAPQEVLWWYTTEAFICYQEAQQADKITQLTTILQTIEGLLDQPDKDYAKSLRKLVKQSEVKR